MENLDRYATQKSLSVQFFPFSAFTPTEAQAGARVLRPQQQNEVDFEYVHIEGSIDEYQAQMVAHKKDSIKSGVDWATPDLDNVEFLHLDTLLGRFVKDLAIKLNVESNKLREAIAA